MTINVSVRVPDGIVVASDSLASSIVPMQQQIQVAMKCSECGHDNPPGLIQAPPIGVPGSSTPLATKLFYIGDFGLTFFGASSLNGRSLFNHVMIFRTSTYEADMQLDDIAVGLSKQLMDAIREDPNLKQAPADYLVGGFQISGYDRDDVDIGKTTIVSMPVGSDPKVESQETYGVSSSSGSS